MYVRNEHRAGRRPDPLFESETPVEILTLSQHTQQVLLLPLLASPSSLVCLRLIYDGRHTNVIWREWLVFAALLGTLCSTVFITR